MNSALTPATRTVHCTEALGWLTEQGILLGASFITSLPDLTEVPELTAEGWRTWFIDAATRVLRACPPEGVTIFYQTDVKRDGHWVDKGYLCLTAAERARVPLLWHKVVCRQPAGTVTFGRSGYAHLLCFSGAQKLNLAKASADVLPSSGESLWTRGMPWDTTLWACRYVKEQTPSRLIVDPFCGKGTVLAAANELGLSAVGVELCRRRAGQARSQRCPNPKVPAKPDVLSRAV